MKSSIRHPNTYVIFVVITISYYITTIFSANLYAQLLVLTYICTGLLGYKLAFNRLASVDLELSPKRVDFLGKALIFIGVIVHLVVYKDILSRPFAYGDLYIRTYGQGYLTVFLDWLPLGILMLMFSKQKKKLSAALLLLSIFYLVFYLFILMKRRQVLFLVIGWGVFLLKDGKFRLRRMNYRRMIIPALVLYALFMIFGRVRGYLQLNSLKDTINYVLQNFDIAWLSLQKLGGDAPSMILLDVIEYVRVNSVEPTRYLATFTSIVPRALWHGKMAAFPEWYTHNFHPEIFHGGYAGSIIAELYLYGHFLGVMIGGLLFGALTKLSKILLLSGQDLLVSILVYVIIILPRLDLASLFILTFFTIIVLFCMYVTLGKLRIRVRKWR